MATYRVGYMSRGNFNAISHTMSTLAGARSFAYEHIGWSYSTLTIMDDSYGNMHKRIIGNVCLYRVKNGPRKDEIIKLWWDKQKDTYQVVYANGRLGDYVTNVIW